MRKNIFNNLWLQEEERIIQGQEWIQRDQLENCYCPEKGWELPGWDGITMRILELKETEPMIGR